MTSLVLYYPDAVGTKFSGFVRPMCEKHLLPLSRRMYNSTGQGIIHVYRRNRRSKHVRD